MCAQQICSIHYIYTYIYIYVCMCICSPVVPNLSWEQVGPARSLCMTRMLASSYLYIPIMTPLVCFAVKKSPCLMVKLYFWELNPHVWWSKPFHWLSLVTDHEFPNIWWSKHVKTLFSVIGCCCLLEPQNSNLSGLWTNQPTYLDWRIDLDSPFPAQLLSPVGPQQSS